MNVYTGITTIYLLLGFANVFELMTKWLAVIGTKVLRRFL